MDSHKKDDNVLLLSHFYFIKLFYKKQKCVLIAKEKTAYMSGKGKSPPKFLKRNRTSNIDSNEAT